MQGSIEQSIGLTVAGNAFLQGRDLGRFWPDSPLFVFCESVRFVEAVEGGNPEEETLVAADPLAWFRSLAKGCKGLRLHAVRRRREEIEDWMDVGLAGGGSTWQIETVGSQAPRSWRADWSLDRAGSRDRPWSVVYHGAPPTRPLPPVEADLHRVEQHLAAGLVAILGFARRIGSHFAPLFEEALAVLERRAPPDRHFLLALGPAGFLSPQAERILGACARAWVFGGMGAWNDGAYEGIEGDRLTDDLFDRLQAALAAAASSSCAA